MRGFKRFFTAYCIVGLLGSTLIIVVAQFVFLPLDSRAMSVLDGIVSRSETAQNIADQLGVLVFRERKSVADIVEAVPIAAPLTPSTPAPAARLTLSAFTAEGPNWGVVRVHEARSYTMKGKSRSRLNAGTAVAVLAQRKTSLGECLECKAFPAGPSQPRFLLLKDDLMLFGGTPDDIPVEAQDLLIEKARTLADLEKLEEDAQKAALMKNPYYQSYQTARADYLDYWKKVKALQAQRDAGQGNAQVEAEDQLRMMKGEDIRVGAAFKKSKATYEEWQRLHPGDPVSEHPKYNTLRTKLDAIDEKIAALPPMS